MNDTEPQSGPARPSLGPDVDRTAKRVNTPRAAKIVYNNGYNVLDCVVKNLSATGARIDTNTHVELPGTFTLQLDDGRKRTAKVVWKKVSEIGVTFVDSLRPDDHGRTIVALLNRIERIESELEELRSELLVHFNT